MGSDEGSNRSKIDENWTKIDQKWAKGTPKASEIEEDCENDEPIQAEREHHLLRPITDHLGLAVEMKHTTWGPWIEGSSRK